MREIYMLNKLFTKLTVSERKITYTLPYTMMVVINNSISWIPLFLDVPVIYSESLDTKNDTRFATSSERPKRPIGTLVRA